MRVPEVLLFYALVGLAVGAATWRASGELRPMSALLWPLWLPVLWSSPTARYDTGGSPPARDPALARLQALLAVWAPDQVGGLTALDRSLVALEGRAAALDAELARPENDLARLRDLAADDPDGAVHRRRLANVEALGALRARLHHERATALAHVEELVSRVQLARFQGESAEGVRRQLADLVAAVDGIGEVEGLRAPPPRAPAGSARSG